MSSVKPAMFEVLAATIMSNLQLSRARNTQDRRFHSFFGTSSVICSILWSSCLPLLEHNATPIHLLWVLMFLKMYNTEEVDASALAGCDEKTVRFWRWEMIKIIAELDVVCSYCTFCFIVFFSAFKSHFVIKIQWENRNIRANGDICHVSIDGTDFRIYEPTPFSPRWFSHKFKGPGLQYHPNGLACLDSWPIPLW